MTLLPPPSTEAIRDFFAAAESGDVAGLRDCLGRYPALISSQDETKATALIVAAKSGQAEAVQALLDAGADREAEDAGGMTALCQAAYYGHSQACDTLVAAGAHPAYAPHGPSPIVLANAGDFPSLSAKLQTIADALPSPWHDVAPILDGTTKPVRVMKQLSLKPKT
jgi:hypothetical protein